MLDVIPVTSFEESLELFKKMAAGSVDPAESVLLLNEDTIGWERCMRIAHNLRPFFVHDEFIQISVHIDRIRNVYVRFWSLCIENCCSFIPRDNGFVNHLEELRSEFSLA